MIRLIQRGAIALLVAALLPMTCAAAGQNIDVRIAATMSTRSLLGGLVPAMKKTNGLQLEFLPDVSSDVALTALVSGTVDMAFITRPVSGEDRAANPSFDLVSTPVGMQVVAIGVSNDIWDAGVRKISKDTMQSIYEKKITNWKDAGGPDAKIKFFNFPQGGGIWEIFAQWLYGDNRMAPYPKGDDAGANLDKRGNVMFAPDSVGAGLDARGNLEFTPDSIAIMPALMADGARCHALALDLDGHTVSPTVADVASGAYPVVRPIIAVTLGLPALGTRAVTEYLKSAEGQEMVKKTGALGLDSVPKAMQGKE